MNEPQKVKPIRDLIEDIAQANIPFRQPRRGLINPVWVDRFTFFAGVATLFSVAAIFVAIIWNVVDPHAALQWCGTILVVMLTILAFRSINSTFE